MARRYDQTVGLPFFRTHRRAFEMLVRRYGIRFQIVADLGCGTGLFACYLSRCWGARVIGVDRAAEMLRVARRNCPDPNVVFLRQDIRHLCLPCPVDLVTCNFDTVNHLIGEGDLAQLFRRVSAHLRPGGHFFFDAVTPASPWPLGFTQRRHFLLGPCEITQTIRWLPSVRLLSVVVVHRWGWPRRSVVELHRERAYSPVELGSWLMDAGLHIRAVHDAHTLTVPSAWPVRTIVIAQKPRRPLQT